MGDEGWNVSASRREVMRRAMKIGLAGSLPSKGDMVRVCLEEEGGGDHVYAQFSLLCDG